MARADAPVPLISPELEEMLRLVGDADSVELKLTVPDQDHRSAASALGIDPLNARIRQVYFFDTPDLALDRAGVVLRARRTQAAPDDTVVKLRPVVPADLPPELRARKDFVVEVDAMPGKYVCSASLKGQAKPGRVQRTVSRAQPLSKLLSKRQRSFFDAHAPTGTDLNELSILGPVTALKLKFLPAGLDRKLAVELWLYPDGSRVAELSTKCAPADWLETTTRARDFLQSRGVSLSGEQATKTRVALEYFSGLHG